MAPVFIALLVFINILLISLGIYYYYIRSGEAIRERVGKIRGDRVVVEEESTPTKLRGLFSNILHPLGLMVLPKKDEVLSQTRKSLSMAGYRGSNATIIFYGAKIFLASVLVLLFTFIRLSFFKLLPNLQTVCLSISSALIGLYLPNLWIHRKISRRQGSILRGLPDALDLLGVCVEAGLGLDAAITRVGREIEMSSPILGEEFRLINLELRAGKPRQDALRGLASRTGLEDVSSLVTLLIQTDKFGTSVAQALRVHCDGLRTRRRQRAEEEAAKMPVKMLFPLILFIFPSIMLVVAGPGIIRIARSILPALVGG